jgi:hypothetical protein
MTVSHERRSGILGVRFGRATRHSEVETGPDPRATQPEGHLIRPDARRVMLLKVDMRLAP